MIMKSSPDDASLELRAALFDFLSDIDKERPIFNFESAKTAGERFRASINRISQVRGGDITNFIPNSRYVDRIKIAQIHSILPEPIDSDSSIYKDFYAALSELQTRHLLGLRFGLRGDTSLHRMLLFIPGSEREFIIQSMQDSFRAFAQRSEEYLNPDEFGISKEALTQIMDTILKNLMQTDPDATAIDPIISSGDNFSLMYHTFGHWTSVVASKNTIIFADRASESIAEPKQITICEMPNAANHSDVVHLLNTLRDESYFHPVPTREHTQSIERNYKHLAYIPLSLQKADNCGWSSGAKTIIYSNSILCFQQYFEAAGLEKSDALNKAIDCSKILYHKWAHDFDRVESLHSYINFHKQNTNPTITPDLIELGKILLQSEQKSAPYRVEITKLINESGLISDEIKAQARASLLDNIRTTLKNDRTSSDKYAKKYLSLYLGEGGTRAADEFILTVERERIRKKEDITAALTKARFLGPTIAKLLVGQAKLTASDFQELTPDQRGHLESKDMHELLSNDLILEKLETRELTLGTLASLPPDERAKLLLDPSSSDDDHDIPDDAPQTSSPRRRR